MSGFAHLQGESVSLATMAHSAGVLDGISFHLVILADEGMLRTDGLSLHIFIHLSR